MKGFIEFIFPRRLHRLSYLLRLILADFVTYYLYASSTTMNPPWWWVAIITLSIYGFFFIALPRLRDTGMNGWWLLIIFVPLVNIWLGLILLFRAPAMLNSAPRDSAAAA